MLRTRGIHSKIFGCVPIRARRVLIAFETEEGGPTYCRILRSTFCMGDWISRALPPTAQDLEMTIKALTEAIDTLKSEIAEMQVQLKRAGEDREKENKEFQMTVADQRQYNRQF